MRKARIFRGETAIHGHLNQTKTNCEVQTPFTFVWIIADTQCYVLLGRTAGTGFEGWRAWEGPSKSSARRSTPCSCPCNDSTYTKWKRDFISVDSFAGLSNTRLFWNFQISQLRLLTVQVRAGLKQGIKIKK